MTDKGWSATAAGKLRQPFFRGAALMGVAASWAFGLVVPVAFPWFAALALGLMATALAGGPAESGEAMADGDHQDREAMGSPGDKNRKNVHKG
jgi:hypothetical protein